MIGRRQWKNVTSEAEITLTDEMREELGLFDDAERLHLDITHSGYYEPARLAADPDDSYPAEDEIEISNIEGYIEFIGSDDEPLSGEQIEILHDLPMFFDAICENIGE